MEKCLKKLLYFVIEIHVNYQCKTCRPKCLRLASYLVLNLDIEPLIIHKRQLLYVVFCTLAVVHCWLAVFQYVADAGTVVMQEIKNRRQFPENFYSFSTTIFKYVTIRLLFG